MSILETFYVLFATDAEEAEKDMDGALAKAEALGDAMATAGDKAEGLAGALDKAGAPDAAGVAKLDDTLEDAAASAAKLDDTLDKVDAAALGDAAAKADDLADALAKAADDAKPITDEMLKTLPVQERIVAGALDQVEAARNLRGYLAGNEALHERTLHLLGGQKGLEKAIAAETSRVAKELGKAAQNADELSDELKEADRAAKGAGRSMSGMTKGLISSLAAVVSVASLIGGVRSHLDSVFQLIERASRARIDVSTYDAWRRAIREAGGDAERAEGQFEAFADKVTEAFGDAESEAAKALKSMGVSAVDAAGNIKTTDAALLDLADAMAGVSRQTAVDSLRRLGIVDPTMVDMILQGREGLERMLEAQRKGGAITAKQAEAYKQFRTAVNALKDAFRSQVDALLGAVLPAFTRVVDTIKGGLEWMGRNRRLVEGFGIALAAAMTVAAGVALAVYAPAMWAAAAATLAATWPILLIIAAVAALAAAFALAYEDVRAFLEGQPSLLGDLASKYGWVRDAIAGVRVALSWLRENGGKVWDAFKRGLDVVLPILRDLADRLLTHLGRNFRVIATVVSAVWSVAAPILKLIAEAVWTIAVVAVRVHGAVYRVMAALFSAVVSLAKPALDTVGGFFTGLGALIGGVVSAVTGVWSTFFSWFADKVGWLANAASGILKLARGASEGLNNIGRQPPPAPRPGQPPAGGLSPWQQATGLVAPAQAAVARADRAPTNATTGAAVAARRPANRTTNVNVAKVEVNTQATDANGMARAAGGALQSELRRPTQDNDDGVDR